MALSTADEPVAAPTPTPIAISGYLEEDLRPAFPNAPAYLERARTIGGFRVEAGPAARTRLVGDARFVWLGETQAGTLSDLSQQATVDPYRVESDALFLEVSRAGHASTWLRFGRQTVRWGSALVIHPTSMVGPVDLEDPLRFGAPMGTEMIRGQWVAGPIHLEGIFVPLFRPPLLPPLDARAALARSGDPNAQAIAADPSWNIAVATSLAPIPSLLSNSQGAVRLSTRIPGIDVDVAGSWYAGRTELPQLSDANLTADFVGKSLTGTATLDFPKLQVAGFDATGQLPAGEALGSIGLFAEGAWVMPMPYTRTVVVNGVIADQERLLTEPYGRLAAGADHTGPGSLYLAAEYLRGFVDELGAPEEKDYLLAIVDQGLFGDRLHLRLAGFLCLGDKSLLAYPEVSWVPADGVTLTAGAYAGTGGGNDKFGQTDVGPPEAIFRARLSF